jgi:hypothetical protein
VSKRRGNDDIENRMIFGMEEADRRDEISILESSPFSILLIRLLSLFPVKISEKGIPHSFSTLSNLFRRERIWKRLRELREDKNELMMWVDNEDEDRERGKVILISFLVKIEERHLQEEFGQK